MSSPRRPSRLRPFLELVRIQLTPTAVADSLTGYFLAGALAGRDDEMNAASVLLLAVTSVGAYWSGMVGNDWFDREKDLARNRSRPIPRGAVAPPAAAAFCLSLSLISLGAAFAISRVVGLTALALIAATNLYNGGGKRIPLVGNLLMGLCRSLNLILGALAVVPPSSLLDRPEVLVAAALLGLYIAGVTAVSLLEDRPHNRRAFLFTTVPLLSVPVALVPLSAGKFWAVLNSGTLGILLATAIARGCQSRATGGSAHPAEKFVRAGLSLLFFVDAGILLTRDLFAPALCVYGLMILAWLWRRRWLQSLP